jgi:hypothetical protein
MGYDAAQFVTLLREMPEEVRERADDRVLRDLDARYVEHGAPCCLVAYLLLQVGVGVNTLKELDRETTRMGRGTPQLRESCHPFWDRFEPAARELLEFLQLLQDYGRTWGEVAQEALEPVRPRGLFGVRWGSRYPSGRPWLPESE